MSSERKSESRIFIVAAAIAVVLSISAMVFAVVQGANRARPHKPPADSRITQRADHCKHGHPPPWFIHAADWMVVVANKGLG